MEAAASRPKVRGIWSAGGGSGSSYHQTGTHTACDGSQRGIGTMLEQSEVSFPGFKLPWFVHPDQTSIATAPPPAGVCRDRPGMSVARGWDSARREATTGHTGQRTRVVRSHPGHPVSVPAPTPVTRRGPSWFGAASSSPGTWRGIMAGDSIAERVRRAK